jgi:glutathione S-transferase
MQLFGMSDSPYVRRVAISLKMLDVPFELHPLSVFSSYEAFSRVNPVVKAPTLVTDDGMMLMDSTLILQHIDDLTGAGHGLMPTSISERAAALRLVGIGLAACEKTVQIVYERKLRPEEKQHAPWVERITAQLLAAYGLLEQACAACDETWLARGPVVTQADITVAVAVRFGQHMIPDVIDLSAFAALAALSARAEALPAFRAVPLCAA